MCNRSSDFPQRAAIRGREGLVCYQTITPRTVIIIAGRSHRKHSDDEPLGTDVPGGRPKGLGAAGGRRARSGAVLCG